MVAQSLALDLVSVLLFAQLIQLGSSCTCTPTPCDFIDLSGLTGSTQYASIECANANLMGTIPTTVGLITNLVDLDLSNNFLTGSLPDDVSLLLNLETLNVESNFLTGELPGSLGSLMLLKTLRIGSNGMTGAIGSDITNLPLLSEFDALPNLFNGEVPSYLSCDAYDTFCAEESTNLLIGGCLVLGSLLTLTFFCAFSCSRSSDDTDVVCNDEVVALTGYFFGAVCFGCCIVSIIYVVNLVQCQARLDILCLATDLPVSGTDLSGLTLAPTQLPTTPTTPTTLAPTDSPTLSFETANPEVFAVLTTGVPLVLIVLIAFALPKRYRDLTVFVGFALFDFAGDLAYISTTTFTSSILFGAAIGILILPGLVFTLTVGRNAIRALATSFYGAIGKAYKTVYYFTGGAEYEEYNRLYKVAHIFMVYVLKIFFFVFATVIGVPVSFALAFAALVLGITLIVNLKLLAIPALAHWLDNLGGERDTSSFWFNGSIVVEVAFESIPELIIVLVNTFSFSGETDAIFIATVVGSGIDIVNAGFPYAYYCLKFGSFTRAMGKENLYGHEASRKGTGAEIIGNT